MDPMAPAIRTGGNAHHSGRPHSDFTFPERSLLTGDGLMFVDAPHNTDFRTDTFPTERINQLTHGFGLLLSVVATAAMMAQVTRVGDALQILGCGVYVASLCGVYAASTLAHTFHSGPRRDFFHMLDQVCIFLLVVGSYTPFGLVHARDGGWWLLLAVMWSFAVAGILVRMSRVERPVGIGWYIMLSWMPLLSVGHVFDVGQTTGLLLVVAGGLAYTGGTWFLANDSRRPYFHPIWHLCTIIGSSCHFLFLYWYVAATPVCG